MAFCIEFKYIPFSLPLALPSEPSSLTVSLSASQHNISFSIREGSFPITHFLVNYTSVLDSPSQLVIPSNDSSLTVSTAARNDSSGIDREFSVELMLSGFNRGVEFRVAGRSQLGDGPFSEWRTTESQGECMAVNYSSLLCP